MQNFVKFEDLAEIVRQQLTRQQGNLFDYVLVPFRLTLNSGIAHRITKRFNFNNFYAFENWHQAIANNDYNREADSANFASLNDIVNVKNVFSIVKPQINILE